MYSDSDRKGRLGDLVLWLRDVASLALAISLVLLAPALLYAAYYAVCFHTLTPFARTFEIVMFMACLRFLVAPSPEY